MKKAYIAGPYRAQTQYRTQENTQYARRLILKYLELGFAPISGHTLYGGLDGEVPDELFLEADLAWLRMLKREYHDIVVMMPNWEESRGAAVEHAVAKENGLKIIYETWDAVLERDQQRAARDNRPPFDPPKWAKKEEGK